MVEELPEGYYLDNFHFLIEFVARQYAHLLNKEELAYSSCFKALTPEAQMLYVRLVQRKGPLFRCDKINYAEIVDLLQTIGELVERDFLDYAPDVDSIEVLVLLSKQELLDLPEATKLDPAQKKNQILEYLSQVEVDLSGIERVRPLQKEYLQLYKLLFFGNLNQDFTEFVLNDLGVMPFEKYPLQTGGFFFENRWLIDETLQLYALNDLIHEAIEENDAEMMAQLVTALPGRCSNDRLARRYDRIVNRLARQYERMGELDAAMSLYMKSRLAPSRERRVRILLKQERISECVDQCSEILASPRNDQEHEFAVRFVHRNRKKAFASARLPRLDTQFIEFRPAIIKVQTAQDPNKRVEEVVCDWFAATGSDAIYVENSLLSGLFGLAFWDVIFAPVKGAFYHPFQRGPADLYDPEFSQLRKGLIEKRFAELHCQEKLSSIVLETFKKKYSIANHFVNWSMLSEDLINRFLGVVSNDSLLMVFRRLLADPRNNRSGFPDLIVFENNGYKLVEVKGPGDRLQENQLRWLRHFSTIGIPAEVAYISFE